jgi:hypothetical protein
MTDAARKDIEAFISAQWMPGVESYELFDGSFEPIRPEARQFHFDLLSRLLPEQAKYEIERAHDEALRQELLRTTPSPLGEWVQQQPGQLFGLDPTTWRPNDVVTGAPHTPAGRLEQAGIWVLHHCTGGRSAHEPDMMHVGLFASPATAMRHVRSVHPQAPEWAPTSLGDFECWIEPFEESNDADKPCRGEWWSLCAMEVRE